MDVRIFAKYVTALGMILIWLAGMGWLFLSQAIDETVESNQEAAVERARRTIEAGGHMSDPDFRRYLSGKQHLADLKDKRPWIYGTGAAGTLVMFMGFALNAAAKGKRDADE